MFIAGHCSNKKAKVGYQETLADKIGLTRKIKDSHSCKTLNNETIANLLGMFLVDFIWL